MQTFKANFYGNTGSMSDEIYIDAHSAQGAARRALRWLGQVHWVDPDRGAQGTVALRDEQGTVIFQRRVG